MNFYKRFFSILLTSLCCFAGGLRAQQIYPILSNLQIAPPYSLYLNDYTVTGSQKMQVSLFLKDLTKNNYPCRLRFKIEGFGITVSSKPDFYVAPLFLNAGEMRVLAGDELISYLDPNNLVFQGLSLTEYQNRGGKLPEGVYRVTVEVLDYYNKKLVSNAGSTVLAAYLSYPPIINLPLANSRVTSLEPQNVMFQWTPRHTGSVNAAYNVAYKFTLVELNPPTRDPNDAVRSSVPLYETFTDQTFLVYGPSEPQLVVGNKYAVKVQAVEAEGRDIFLNEGNSELVSFTYGIQCEAPNYVFAEVAGVNRMKVSWGNLPNQVSFEIRYREANNASAAWFEQTTTETSYTIEGLRPGRVYEYQVRAQCVGGFGDYTPLGTFQAPDEALSQGDLVCGQTRTISGLSTDALNILTPGMFFMAGTFPITVTEVSGANGVFSGKGTVGIPLLNKLNFLVSFSNISINSDLKLINGKVSVATQPLDVAQDQLISNMTLTPDANGKVIAIENNNLPNFINVFIPNPPTTLPVYNPTTKTITFPGVVGEVETGTAQTITIELKDSQPPYVFQDKKGETYEVAKDGTVTYKGKISPTELLAGGSLTSKPIDNAKAKVTFSGSASQKYGFDTFNTNLKGNTKYNAAYSLANDGTTGNRISWKSIEAGKGDAVEATISITDNFIDKDKLEFRTGNGDVVSAAHTAGTTTYTIQLVGAPAGNDKEIYAYYPTGKEKDAGLNLGKINIASFKAIQKKVVLVPVNGAGATLNASNVQTALNNIYKQAVVNWTVTIATNYSNNSWDLNSNGLEVDNSNALSAYTAEQKKLASLYKASHSLESGTYYIFIVDRFNIAEQEGYMVRGGQVGFVKAGSLDLTRTIAHELGHGAFRLKHIWDMANTSEGVSANLMDYPGGNELSYAQWKYMRNQDLMFRPFEEDDNGAYQTDGHYSTVYLVSLMLGMDKDKAKALAAATEDPDTDMHSDVDFELDATWAESGAQQTVHSLTGGFHGAEELMTAFKILYTDRDNLKLMGELLHRYGDTYAHTKLNSINPLDLQRFDDLPEDLKIDYVMQSWRDQAGLNIATHVNPWIRYLNHYVRKFGYKFLTSPTLQKQYLNGRTLIQYLHDIYLQYQPIDKFVMYGGNQVGPFPSGQHNWPDGGIPDYIYVRPRWYLTYVQNLATLLASKYNLNSSNLDISTFERMVNFAQANRCSLKGIIDYEIAKKKGANVFYVPVFYANPDRLFATADAMTTDYKKVALDAVDMTKLYLSKLGKTVEIKEISTEKVHEGTFQPDVGLMSPSYKYNVWAYEITVK